MDLHTAVRALRDTHFPGTRIVYDQGMTDIDAPKDDAATPSAVTTTLSLDADVSEVALHTGVTNYGYTLTRDLRNNTLTLTIVTK